MSSRLWENICNKALLSVMYRGLLKIETDNYRNSCRMGKQTRYIHTMEDYSLIKKKTGKKIGTGNSRLKI